MRVSQWFVLAIVFLLMAIYFQYAGTSPQQQALGLQAENLRELMDLEKGKWTEAFGIKQLTTGSYANTLFIASNTLLNFSSFCWGLFVACAICGVIERRAEKRKK